MAKKMTFGRTVAQEAERDRRYEEGDRDLPELLWSGRFCQQCFLELPFDTKHCAECDD